MNRRGPAGADLSVVIPVQDEEANLPELWQRLAAVLPPDSEVLFVDDGSSDGSRAFLEGVAESDARAKLICLRKHFGKTTALAAGFSAARGEWVAVMDADLQNDPADLPLLLAKSREGYDVVSGWRKNRQDPWLAKVFPSLVANALVARVTGLPLHDFGCALQLCRREVLQRVNLARDMHRLLPAYLHLQGAKVAEVEVRHRPRRSGVSHYGWERVPKILFDLAFLGFSRLPGRWPFLLAGGIASLSLLGSLALAVLAWSCGPQAGLTARNVLALAAVVLGVTGAVLLALALFAGNAVRLRARSVNELRSAIEKIVNCRELPPRSAG